MDSDTEEYTEYRTDISETDDIPSPTRPGRFKGPKSTWRTFNEDEITLADSLVQLGAEDLSAHLYNTHVMKRSLYDANLVKGLKPWASKERWRQPVTADDEGKGFVPPERWTAWPLEPEVIPRGEETRADDVFTLKRVDVERPSRELEEILTGLVLKLAKDKFEEREWESEDEARDSEDEENDSTQDNDQDEVLRDADAHISDSEAFTQPSLEVPSSSRPIISSDDDRSSRLLRPTIRHTLTHLDTLLTALQISRRACLRPNRSPSPANDLDNSTVEPDQPSPDIPASPKRPRGRPRRIVAHPPVPLQLPSTPKKDARGRKKKIHVPLPDETHAEMLVRIAREQHKGIPFAAMSPEKRSTSRSSRMRSQSQSQSRSRSRSHSRSSSRGSRARLGVRDWSEVIGAAALAGWPEGVVERAGRRCAKLFGEGMGVRVLTEGAMGGEAREEMYLPEEVPDFGELSEELDETADMPLGGQRRSTRAGSRPESRHHSRGLRSGGDEKKKGISEFGIYAAYCPLRDCERRDRGFNSERALRDHLRLGHGMGAEEIDGLEGEQEMVGGVHRDGFGVMLKRRKGWRAGNVKQTGGDIGDDDDSTGVLEKAEEESEGSDLSD